MTSAEEAWKLLADARERLRHAEDTRRIGIYGPAVAMAYFAAFYAAQAVVAYHREGPQTHQGVLARFHFLAVKNPRRNRLSHRRTNGRETQRRLRPCQDGNMGGIGGLGFHRPSTGVRERSIRLVRSPSPAGNPLAFKPSWREAPRSGDRSPTAASNGHPRTELRTQGVRRRVQPPGGRLVQEDRDPRMESESRSRNR